MDRNNDFQKTFTPARKWTALLTGSKTTRQDKLYSDIYGSTSNGHSSNEFSSPLLNASRKRQIDDSSDIAYDAKRNRNIDIKPEETPLPRKKLFVITKASKAKASTSVSVPRRNIDVKPEETPLPRKKLFVSTKASEAKASTSSSVPRRNIDVKPEETPLPRKKLFVSTKASEVKASTSASVPRRIIDVKPEETPLSRKKLFVSTKASEAKASTSVSVPRRNIDIKPEETPLPRKKLFVSTKASEAKASTSVSVPRRIPLVTPANESTAMELLERQEEGVRRQLERVREKLGMLITNRRYDDDDSFFTIRDRRIQSNLYYDFDKKEWMEYTINLEEELPGPSVERKPIVQIPKKSYRKRNYEAMLARKDAAYDTLFSEPLLIIPCSSKKARIETDTRQH